MVFSRSLIILLVIILPLLINGQELPDFAAMNGQPQPRDTGSAENGLKRDGRLVGEADNHTIIDGMLGKDDTTGGAKGITLPTTPHDDDNGHSPTIAPDVIATTNKSVPIEPLRSTSPKFTSVATNTPLDSTSTTPASTTATKPATTTTMPPATASANIPTSTTSDENVDASESPDLTADKSTTVNPNSATAQGLSMGLFGLIGFFLI